MLYSFVVFWGLHLSAWILSNEIFSSFERKYSLDKAVPFFIRNTFCTNWIHLALYLLFDLDYNYTVSDIQIGVCHVADTPSLFTGKQSYFYHTSLCKCCRPVSLGKSVKKPLYYLVASMFYTQMKVSLDENVFANKTILCSIFYSLLFVF